MKELDGLMKAIAGVVTSVIDYCTTNSGVHGRSVEAAFGALGDAIATIYGEEIEEEDDEEA